MKYFSLFAFTMITFTILLLISCAQENIHRLSLHVIDVDHGDAMLIRGSRLAVLIDAGYPDQASHVVSYLQEQGIAKLDAIIVSHTDDDHIGGVASVMNNFPVGKVYWNGIQPSESSPIYDAFLQSIAEKSVIVQKDTILMIRNIPFEIFAFFDEYGISQNNDENSLVLHINGYLLTGDCTYRCSDKLATLQLTIPIMKLPHHGSGEANVSMLLDNFKPSFVIINDGKPFEKIHPARSTLEELKERNIPYRRTSADGDFIFVKST